MWGRKAEKTDEVVFVHHSNLIVRQYLRSLLEEAGHTVHIFDYKEKMTKNLQRKYGATFIWDAISTDRSYRLSLHIEETNLSTKRSENIYTDLPLLGKNLTLKIKSALMKNSRKKLKVLVGLSDSTTLWHLLDLIKDKGHTYDAYDNPNQITPQVIRESKADLIWRVFLHHYGYKKSVVIKEENRKTGKITEIKYDLDLLGPAPSTKIDSKLLNKK